MLLRSFKWESGRFDYTYKIIDDLSIIIEV